jgi:hypothetical protein
MLVMFIMLHMMPWQALKIKARYVFDEFELRFTAGMVSFISLICIFVGESRSVVAVASVALARLDDSPLLMCFSVPVCCFFLPGAVATLIGIGGATVFGPILFKYKMMPTESTATTGYTLIVSAFSTSVQCVSLLPAAVPPSLRLWNHALADGYPPWSSFPRPRSARLVDSKPSRA